MIYFLEMNAPDALSAKNESNGLIVQECEIKQFQINRFLYQFVGSAWRWTDKALWSDEHWKMYAESPCLRTWIAYLQGSPTGYYELQQQDNGNVEIAYFGLAPHFTGKGFGGYLLTHAIQMAWEWEGTKRVWVHTCSFDHPSALHNYQNRGMKIYKIEEQ